jgi:uncharacterized membrane protein HdeD (DUF308 family)
MIMRSGVREVVGEATEYWWVLLISGIVWILLSLAILQFNLTSVWSIAILTGIVLWLAAITEFSLAFMAPSWRWAHILLGILFGAGGIIAFAWPGETFIVLARLIGWYLLFLGTFEVVESLFTRRTELWWLRLIVGAATIGIAFWAVGSITRSVTLLILWVGIGAVFRGVTQIFMAFEFRQIHEKTKPRAAST